MLNHVHSDVHAGVSSDLNLQRFCAGCQSSYKFTCAAVLIYIEDTVFL